MKQYKGIKSLPRSEQPYEKAERFGISSLSDAELLAIILRNGAAGRNAYETACDILEASDGLSGLNGREFLLPDSIRGIGRVKRLQLAAVGELSKRIWAQGNEPAFAATSPADIYLHYREFMRYLQQEEVWILLLNHRMRRIRELVVTRGTVNRSGVSPRDIFRLALLNNAACFVLMHNHPGGDPNPSTEDRLLTDRVRTLSDMLGVPMLDHIIFGRDSYFSFRDEKKE